MHRTEAIRMLQQMLNSTLQPSPNLVVDGLMGSRTRGALARYNAMKMRINEGNVGRLISASNADEPEDTNADSDGWMSIAEGELGQAEVAGSGNNPRIVEYHAATSLHAQSDEVPWCSSFVNWVMRQAGYIGTNSAAARSWIGWGAPTQPRYGAITVIKRKHAGHDAATGSSSGFHVAFLVELTSTRVRLLGGNQSDMVKLSNFHLASYEVQAHRWPR